MRLARLWACEGKPQFTAQQARQIAKRARRRWHERLSEYRCRECGFFHVGHPSKRDFGGRRRILRDPTHPQYRPDPDDDGV